LSVTIERLNLSLWEPVSAYKALATAWTFIKPLLMAGHRLTLEVRQEKRSDAENRLLHAMLTYIAKNREWAGSKRDAETWKRLLTAAWLRARGEHVEMLPALDGCGIDVVFRRTSDLTRSECAELITFIYAWGADNDLEFPAPSIEAPPKAIARKPARGTETIDAETGEILEVA
jgi:hypothetical protein